MPDRLTAQLFAAALLLLLLLIASVKDLRSRRISNRLVATTFVAGILVSTAFDPLFSGLLRALAGAGVGLAIWLPGWLLRMMGAGDVKLFAAAAAWLGPIGAVNAAVFAALAGGVLALLWMLARRGPLGTKRTLWAAVVAPRTLVNARMDSENVHDLVPYSLAILVGVMAQLISPGLVFG